MPLFNWKLSYCVRFFQTVSILIDTLTVLLNFGSLWRGKKRKYIPKSSCTSIPWLFLIVKKSVWLIAPQIISLIGKLILRIGCVDRLVASHMWIFVFSYSECAIANEAFAVSNSNPIEHFMYIHNTVVYQLLWQKWFQMNEGVTRGD